MTRSFHEIESPFEPGRFTDELDRELQLWRRRGLRVVRLTGEAAVDSGLIQAADVWVATTEKFEAICRAGSLRDALAEVDCLVVDEIHLLGDPVRGAVLEALLARVWEDGAGARIVGLSATVANADEVAEWLGARLVRTAWRPTRLTWQLPVLSTADEADWAARAAVRTEAAVRIARGVGADGGSVLVFCGSKRRVRATALALASDRGVPTAGVDADDAELVERLCTKAGVRLHYRDWPYKRDAEQAFRAREADILVATSTVAAGVNLPARAVIVADTTIGLDRAEVSMVQQMFGRAGRIGAGEREVWAFLLADPGERAHGRTGRPGSPPDTRCGRDWATTCPTTSSPRPSRNGCPRSRRRSGGGRGRWPRTRDTPVSNPCVRRRRSSRRRAVCAPPPARTIGRRARWAG
ncbi:helicase-related protein [Streptomyces acidiscabies]|uniref:helicase-related protein n=1 Tax=Streptomyces acidiscabies TaxID=42234 RepID=UPI0038F76C3D